MRAPGPEPRRLLHSRTKLRREWSLAGALKRQSHAHGVWSGSRTVQSRPPTQRTDQGSGNRSRSVTQEESVERGAEWVGGTVLPAAVNRARAAWNTT